MLYPNGVSTCQIAGAIALAAVHDLKVNLFTFPGFPQIFVSESNKTSFVVSLSFTEGKRRSIVEFEISEKLGFQAGIKFKTSKTYPQELFEPVQNALAKLEGKVSRAERV